MSKKPDLAIGYYPDASICRVNDTYYMACSSFQYFPALPIYESHDLTHWRQIGYGLNQIHVHALITQTKSKYGIRYPAIRHYGGKFYLIATHTEYHQHFLVSADDPAGQWSDPVQIEGDSERASLFFDDNGQAYCVLADKTSARLCEIDPQTGQQKSQPKTIWTADEAGHFLHAPHLHQINGQYVLAGTANQVHGDKYVTLLTSNTIDGKFQANQNHSPLMDQNTGLLLHVNGTFDLVNTPDGGQHAVYQSDKENMPRHLGGLTFLASLQGEIPATTSTEDELMAEDDRDDIVLPELELHWQFIRNTLDDSEWSVEERAGWLRLNGSALTLSNSGAPVFVGRKQQHARCKIATMVDFEPQRGQEEAGLALYVDENHHYEIAVTSLAENTRSVIVRRKIGSLAAVVAFENLPGTGLIKLGINANEWTYTFFYQLMDSPEKQIASGETHYLSQAVTQMESGVYFGVYATGNGRKSTAPAYFDWVDYIPEA